MKYVILIKIQTRVAAVRVLVPQTYEDNPKPLYASPNFFPNLIRFTAHFDTVAQPFQ